MAECNEGPMVETNQYRLWRCAEGHVHLRVARQPGGSKDDRTAVGIDFMDIDTFNVFVAMQVDFKNTFCKPPIAIPDEFLKAFEDKPEERK